MTGPGLEDLTAEIVWESSPDGLLLVDSDGRVVWVNAEAERMFGYPASELVRQPIEQLVPSEVEAQHREHRRDYAFTPRRRAMGADRHLEGLRRDGSVFPVQVALSPLRLADRAYTIAAVRDETEWVESEQRLAAANRRRALAEDHQRIARELHDTVIQELFAVGLGLQAMTGAIDAGPLERVEQSIDTIDSIIRSIRTVIFDISHPVERPPGLRPAVIDVVGDVTPALGFEPEVTFVGPVDADVPDSIIEQLVPTLREALTNVVKHAGAGEVDVTVIVSDGRFELVVEDDGRGVPADPSGGQGLVNLARRAALLGGGLRIEARDGGGTTLAWQVPVASQPS